MRTTGMDLMPLTVSDITSDTAGQSGLLALAVSVSETNPVWMSLSDGV